MYEWLTQYSKCQLRVGNMITHIEVTEQEHPGLGFTCLTACQRYYISFELPAVFSSHIFLPPPSSSSNPNKNKHKSFCIERVITSVFHSTGGNGVSMMEEVNVFLCVCFITETSQITEAWRSLNAISRSFNILYFLHSSSERLPWGEREHLCHKIKNVRSKLGCNSYLLWPIVFIIADRQMDREPDTQTDRDGLPHTYSLCHYWATQPHLSV